ncbi:MAG: hypothetical protein K5761_05355 [Clostridiales bacterium]|nr:hypothetical protein [Clostridiales bacterium]
MKRVMAADFFEVRKSKLTYLIMGVSFLLGILLPMMYYALSAILNNLGTLDILQGQDAFTAVNALIDALNAKEVFLSVLPLSQGVGFMTAAAIGFKAVHPFGTGIYRNKIIAQIPRASIYLSQSFFCLILMMLSAVIFTFTAAVTSHLAFDGLELAHDEIVIIAVLSAGIYLVYTAIPVFVAFYSRSVPATIIVSMLVPILTQTIVALVSTALNSAPKIFTEILAVLPAFQNVYLMHAQATDKVLIISAVSDVVITAGLTALGILHFKKADIN